MTTTATPTSTIDLFDDEQIRAPYEAYRALRDAGPVVWLEQTGVWAITRYAEVKDALENWQVFSSAQGVSLTPQTNEGLRGTTLASDPPLHDHLRGVVGERLTPRALRPMRDTVDRAADELVERVVAQGQFDAVTELAQVLPLQVVPDFVGWPEEIRGSLLPWAAAGFDTMGPPNERCEHAMVARRSMYEYAVGLSQSRNLIPGSLGAGVLDALDSQRIDADQCPALLLDYLVPALDTTISSVGTAVWLFGRHPEQWNLVRDDPSLIPNAYNEVLRVESPVRAFTRVTTEDTVVAGSLIPAGSRVLLLFASANRDERRFDRPDDFDVTRTDANAHIAFGFGVHGCAGQGLARLEGHAVLAALAARVRRFTVGEPTPVMNNMIRAFASLPVTVERV